MEKNNYLFTAKVFHKRFFPKQNAFRYSLYYLCFPLSKLSQITCRLLGINRKSIFTFHEKDHGNKEISSLQEWAKNILQNNNIKKADGEIAILTLPRFLGYVFNPVTFYFCLDKNKKLRVVISEVNNTFGETHFYICYNENEKEIKPNDTLITKKDFHVSPFFEVDGEYKFRFSYNEKNIGIWIDHYQNDRKMLVTSLIGKRENLSDKKLLLQIFAYPFITLKVIILIHWQAIKLKLKGVKYRNKPKQKKIRVTKSEKL